MKHKWFFLLSMLIIASALLGVASAFALDSGSLVWWTVDGGGGTFSNGGNYSLGGSIGQPDAGSSSGGEYALEGGFWGGSVDSEAPVVLSSLRMDPDPTAATSVNFEVSFSESVTGVDTGDFSLTTTGVSGVAVSGVSGTDDIYTVTVNTGTGNGTIRLDVPVSATVTDLIGNSLSGLPFTSGEIYTIEKSVSATFADVPTSYWAWSYIERLYAAGITGGCGSSPLIYCPEATVTRGQMAVFLERGMNGSSYTPPAATGTVFGDVPVSYWSAAWIEKLYVDGITGGCGGGNYCPEASVTRAQMAVFLLRAKHGSSYSPPAATGDFGDVPTSYWAASWIEQLTAEGITSGCGGGNYCPEQPVSRAQMAVFLVRTFGLP